MWTVLLWAGATLSLVGLLDLGLTWLPLRFGTPEWEFGTVTSSLNALPVVTLGLGLLLAAALAEGRRMLARVVSITLVGLTLCVVAAAVLYATNLPFILEAAGQPAFAEGLRKSMVKTAIQVVLYPSAFLVLATIGWRRSRRRR